MRSPFAPASKSLLLVLLSGSLLAGCGQLSGLDIGSDEQWKKHLAKGAASMQAEKLALAESEYKAAAAASERFGPTDARHAKTLLDLAGVQAKLEHYDGAIDSLSKAAALFGRERPENPGGEETRDVGINMAQTLFLLADVQAKMQKTQEAETNYRRALQLATANLGSDGLRYDISMHHAALLRSLNRGAEAKQLETAVADLTPSRPDERTLTGGSSWEDLLKGAQAARQGGNISESERLYHAAIDQIVKANVTGTAPMSDSDIIHLSQSFTGLADVYDVQDRYDEANNLLDRSMQILKKCKTDHREQTVATLYRHALVHLHQGRLAKAELLLRETLQEETGGRPEKHSGLLERRILEDLGKVLMQEEKYAEARKMVELKRKQELTKYGPNHEKVVIDDDLLGQICEKAGQFADSEKYYQSGIAIFERRKPTPPEVSTWLQIQRNYADFLKNRGRLEEGAKLEKKAKADETEAANTFMGKD